MTFRSSGPWLGLAASAWLGSVQVLTAADAFLAPRLSLEAGHEDNRFSAAAALTNAESSAFLRATPALDLHLLSQDGSEWALGASATRTDYLSDDLGFREGAEAHLEGWRTAAPLGGGLRLAGGFARDDALPEDDLRWLAAVPSLRWTLPSPAWQLAAQIRLDWTDYDTRLTYDGEGQRDLSADVRVGLHWLPTRALSLWSEVYLEDNDSNEESVCYQGAGIALGAGYWILPRGQLAASLQAGTRAFQTISDDAGAEIDRQDVPLVAEILYTHRLAPWLDLFCAGSWQATGSDQPEQDVDNWTLRIGATFAQDFELFSR